MVKKKRKEVSVTKKKDYWGSVDFHVKVAVAAFLLAVLKLWPGALEWLGRTNVWWFIIAFIVFAIKPMRSP